MLDRLAIAAGLPSAIVCGSEPEFADADLGERARVTCVVLHFFDPGEFDGCWLCPLHRSANKILTSGHAPPTYMHPCT